MNNHLYFKTYALSETDISRWWFWNYSQNHSQSERWRSNSIPMKKFIVMFAHLFYALQEYLQEYLVYGILAFNYTLETLIMISFIHLYKLQCLYHTLSIQINLHYCYDKQLDISFPNPDRSYNHQLVASLNS